jgi:oxygen-independent coproporphyrinogen-3 oxidase
MLQVVPRLSFGGGTPTALSTAQLELLLRGFAKDSISSLTEWTIEANPAASPRARRSCCDNSGSAGSASESSPGTTTWVLGREHNAQQAEASFQIVRDSGSDNVNIDPMFGLPDKRWAMAGHPGKQSA